MYMYPIFVIRSSVDGHLGGLHVVARVKSAAVSMGFCVSFEVEFLLVIFPGVGSPGHSVVLFLLFETLLPVLHSG